MILEFADKVAMDEVVDEFENWPDEVICSPIGSTRRTIVVNPVVCVPVPVTLSNAYISTVIYHGAFIFGLGYLGGSSEIPKEHTPGFMPWGGTWGQNLEHLCYVIKYMHLR